MYTLRVELSDEEMHTLLGHVGSFIVTASITDPSSPLVATLGRIRGALVSQLSGKDQAKFEQLIVVIEDQFKNLQASPDMVLLKTGAAGLRESLSSEAIEGQSIFKHFMDTLEKDAGGPPTIGAYEDFEDWKDEFIWLWEGAEDTPIPPDFTLKHFFDKGYCPAQALDFIAEA